MGLSKRRSDIPTFVGELVSIRRQAKRCSRFHLAKGGENAGAVCTKRLAGLQLVCSALVERRSIDRVLPPSPCTRRKAYGFHTYKSCPFPEWRKKSSVRRKLTYLSVAAGHDTLSAPSSSSGTLQTAMGSPLTSKPFGPAQCPNIHMAMLPKTPQSLALLPLNVQREIRSSVVITSLTNVVEELFKNALDGRASQVHILVDFGKGFCSVKDDGTGIPGAEFAESGHLAQFHYSSKFGASAPVYGESGRFLASLSGLSLMSITSSHLCSHTANSLTFHRSEVISRRLDIPREEADLHSHGTLVLVHNLFSNIPVRSKHQSARFLEEQEVEKEYHQLKTILISYLLAYSQPVGVSLAVKNTKLRFKLKPPRQEDMARTNPFSFRKLEPILRQLPPELPQESDWKLASARAGEVSIRALICLQPGPSKQCQFVSIGPCPLSPLGQGSIFYNLINELFESSIYGAKEGKGSQSETQEAKVLEKLFSRNAKAGKAVDRWPSFCIRIDPTSNPQRATYVDRTQEDSCFPGVMHTILSLLRALILEFLTDHHLRPRTKRHTPQDLVPAETSTLLSSSLKTKSHYSAWRRVKGARPIKDEEIFGELPLTGELKRALSNTLSLDQDFQILLDDLETEESAAMPEKQTIHVDPAESSFVDGGPDLFDHDVEFVGWKNPRTRTTSRLNPQNGFILRQETGPLIQQDGFVAHHSIVHCRPRRQLQSSSELRRSLVTRLKKYDARPTFHEEEMSIPTVVPFNEETLTSSRGVCASMEQSIDVSCLRQGRVIGQVNHKFILAVVPIQPLPGERSDCESNSTNYEALLLIDQHAADERIKLECLYMELCSRSATSLTKPINFDISSEEANLFYRLQSNFASWSIVYEVKSPTRRTLLEDSSNMTCKVNGAYSTLTITRLPSLVAERCRLEPKNLINMMREEIWSHQHRIQPIGDNSAGAGPQTKHSWMTQMADCPQGLVEMLKSRACRSAIMFNDHLSDEQCQSLFQRLSHCAFPFQCAHGRPSMTISTTLRQTELGNKQKHWNTRSRVELHSSFGKAFDNWK